MTDFSRVIFVDEENTALSVMAEAMMNEIRRGRNIEVLSRGMVVLFPEPVNAKAELILANHALHAARNISEQLETADIDAKTLILTMTEPEKRKILENFPNANFVYTIREFAGDQGDVTEPNGTLENYEECFQSISGLVTSISEILFKED